MKKSALILLTVIFTNSLFPMLLKKEKPKILETVAQDFNQRFKDEPKALFNISEDQLNIKMYAYSLKCDKTRKSMVQFIENLKGIIKNSKKKLDVKLHTSKNIHSVLDEKPPKLQASSEKEIDSVIATLQAYANKLTWISILPNHQLSYDE